MLKLFYEKRTDLYPQEICTMNVPSLIHLTQTVRNWGPLWSCSCTRNVVPQLVSNIRFHQSTLDQEYSASDHEDGICGRIRHRELCMEILQALHETR